MTTFGKVKRELAEQREQQHFCLACGNTAAWETMSTYGGRCGACFAAFCRAGPPPRVDVGSKAKGPRDWAYALQRRHQAGETLSRAQIAAYKEALAGRLDEVIE